MAQREGKLSEVLRQFEMETGRRLSAVDQPARPGQYAGLRLLSLTDYTDPENRQRSLAIRLAVDADAPRFREEHVYAISDLIEYADRLGENAQVLLSKNLASGTRIRVESAQIIREEAVRTVRERLRRRVEKLAAAGERDAVQQAQAQNELGWWMQETHDL